MIMLDFLIMVLLGHSAVIGQPRNFKFRYQGITKLGLTGSKLTIECPLTGPFYLWRLFQTNSDSRVLLDQDSKSIIFDSVTTDRTGIYECKSTTGFGNAVTNITVKIIDPNSDVTKEICSFKKPEMPLDISGGLCFFNDAYQKKTHHRLGNDTELDCEAVGNNVRYTWKFIDQNGGQERIPDSNNVTRLTINNIVSENEGTYKCEAMNDQGVKIYRMFPITVSDISASSDLEIIGDKYVSYSINNSGNVSMVCEIKRNYRSIHSIKWGKRIGDTIFEPRSSSNIVFWDSHNYRVLPQTGIVESRKDPNVVVSTLTIVRGDQTNSGIYICLAMNSYGGTVYKLFNITVSMDLSQDTSGKRSQLFFLYILSPALLILICICAIIYCCIKSNSVKSSNSLPLKSFNNSIPSNGNKTTTSNYYYPVTTSRTNTSCPPLPQTAESQAPLGSPNTITSYNSYGNYQFAPSNQQSCCTINGV